MGFVDTHNLSNCRARHNEPCIFPTDFPPRRNSGQRCRASNPCRAGTFSTITFSSSSSCSSSTVDIFVFRPFGFVSAFRTRVVPTPVAFLSLPRYRELYSTSVFLSTCLTEATEAPFKNQHRRMCARFV